MTDPQQPGFGGQQPLSKKDAKAQAAAAKAYSKAQRSWFSRHKILSGLAAFILLIVVVVVAVNSGGGDDTVNTADSGNAAADAPKQDAPKAEDPKPKYAGALKDDKVASAPGAEISLSGWTTTASALKPTENPLGTNLCSNVSMTNRDDKQQEYNGLSWKLQTPNGNVQDITFGGENDLSTGGLAPGGNVSKTVCFEDQNAGAGQYILSWTPDIFSNKARGIWLNTL